jgi:hypothetical protein
MASRRRLNRLVRLLPANRANTGSGADWFCPRFRPVLLGFCPPIVHRDAGPIGHRERLVRCCVAWRLSHKSPSDPVMGRDLHQRRESRYVSHRSRSQAFRTHLRDSLQWIRAVSAPLPPARMQERHELQSRAGGRRGLARSEHPTRELGDVRLNERKQEWLLVARHHGHSVQMHGTR